MLRKAAVPLVLLLVAVAVTSFLMISCREGLAPHKSVEPTQPGAIGLPEAHKGSDPTNAQRDVMFPGVPFDNAAAAASLMGPGGAGGQAVTPQAPSAALEQILGFIQPLGAAPELSSGTGARVGSSTSMLGVPGVPGGPGGAGSGASGPGVIGGGVAGGPSGPGGAQGNMGPGPSGAGASTRGAQSALPPGIPKSKIPPGQENLYILKSEIVPPVCPACPACPACPTPVCPKPDDSQCPPCPAPGRCPPSSFGCQRVPLYQNMNSGVMPSLLG